MDIETGHSKIVPSDSSDEKEYLKLFSGMQDGYMLVKHETEQPGFSGGYRIFGVNPNFELITGLINTNIAGQAITDIDSWVVVLLPEMLKETTVTGKPVSREYQDDKKEKTNIIDNFFVIDV